MRENIPLFFVTPIELPPNLAANKMDGVINVSRFSRYSLEIKKYKKYSA